MGAVFAGDTKTQQHHSAALQLDQLLSDSHLLLSAPLQSCLRCQQLTFPPPPITLQCGMDKTSPW